MDVYLSLEAQREFEVLQALDSGSRWKGFLLGHKIGRRHFVEKIFPTTDHFFSSLNKYLSTEQLMDGRVLGFFSFQPEREKPEKVLAPFAYRKIFIQVHSQKKHLNFTSFIIEYDHNFFLSPVKIITP